MSDEIVREFLVESNENLDLLDREFVQLEKDPTSRERLAGVFRTIHTIKGACGFLGFKKLESVAHVGENLLTRLRDGELTLRPEITTTLLEMVDAIRQMLGQIEATGAEGVRDDAALIDKLTALQRGEPAPVAPPPLPRAPAPRPAAAASPADAQAAADKVVAPSIGDLLIRGGAATAADVESAVKIQRDGDPRHLGEILVERGAVKPQELVEALRTQQVARAAVSEASIRIDVALLDKLMNLVGELVLARNQILQFSNTTEDVAIVAPSQRLNLLTTELQEGVMKTRMQPIGNIWSKFPRTVRDVAMSCGKQVRIEMHGQETEIDKTIIEAIKDPLTHLVRNSVDHGIERPEVRVAAGKQAEGCLTLRAYHHDGQVNIEIADDGAGLNMDRIRSKTIERGLLSAEKAARLTEREVFNLIFLPGFSTAEKITNVSGRGVGMDVVKTNIEKIGGSVDVQSTAGAGTTVKMRIPLTLAIIPGLVVVSGGTRFVIPQASLIELVRIEGDRTRTGIEMVHGSPVYRLRGRLLPLAYLDRELKIKKAGVDAAVNADAAVNMVVLQADNRQFGLIVDEIRDTEEIVVKPLGRRLKGLKTFAGATIMGDGQVALILDVLGLAQHASILSQVPEQAMATSTEAGNKEQTTGQETFLVFNGPDQARMALPLDALARLEEFPAEQMEMSGAQSVIQYRGQILPLIHLRAVLQERRRRPRHESPAAGAQGPASVQVLVCNHAGGSVGIVVEQILDIIEDRPDVKSPPTRPGVLYAVVLENRVTELLDLDAILRAATAMPAHDELHAQVVD
ncbi:MAG: chemotaxis protein CheW [Candidatus Acidiferrum sp.]|jgi:two-component system chemotaxis sensor kinase CheA